MKIFLRHLPPGVTPRQLEEFATKAITPPWYRPFAPRGMLKSHVVLRIKDLDRGTVEYHGVLDVQPVQAGLAALLVLNRLRFQDRPVEARKWQDRTGRKERRDFYPVEVQGLDRRQGDRRRERLVIDRIETQSALQFQGLKGFHREYGG